MAAVARTATSLAHTTVMALVLLSSAAFADAVTRWRPLVDEASARFGVPARWIEAVIRAESGGQQFLAGRPITSPAGAMGLMQLMPATWAELHRALPLGPDPDNAHDNILAGTAYLRQMYDRFGYPGLFAAYNVGPGRYAAALATSTLPRATRAYLTAVESTLTAIDGHESPAVDRLFYLRQDNSNGRVEASDDAQPNSLFAIVSPRR